MKRIALFCLTFAMTVLAYGYDTELPAPSDTTGTEKPQPDEPQQPGDDDKEELVEKLKVSIIGDSYSTFEGWSNVDLSGNGNGFAVYYPALDVTSVQRTWWYMLCQKPEFEFEANNSYSGSVICNTWYGGGDVTGDNRSFITRAGKSYNGNPDIILILGGTNDSWAGSPIGDYVYEDWTYDDLLCFRPGFAKLLATLQETYPDAKIYNIQNDGDSGVPGLTAPVASSMPYICKHYKVPNIILRDIAKEDGHPTYAGMQAICSQVYDVLTGKAAPAPEPEGEPNTSNIDEWVTDVPLAFSVKAAHTVETRTYNDGLRTYWNEGDAINLFHIEGTRNDDASL